MLLLVDFTSNVWRYLNPYFTFWHEISRPLHDQSNTFLRDDEPQKAAVALVFKHLLRQLVPEMTTVSDSTPDECQRIESDSPAMSIVAEHQVLQPTAETAKDTTKRPQVQIEKFWTLVNAIYDYCLGLDLLEEAILVLEKVEKQCCIAGLENDLPTSMMIPAYLDAWSRHSLRRPLQSNTLKFLIIAHLRREVGLEPAGVPSEVPLRLSPSCVHHCTACQRLDKWVEESHLKNKILELRVGDQHTGHIMCRLIQGFRQ